MKSKVTIQPTLGAQASCLPGLGSRALDRNQQARCLRSQAEQLQSKIITLICALVVALMASSGVQAQQPPSTRTSTQLPNGAYVAFKTDYVSPRSGDMAMTGPTRSIETRVEAESNVLHRVLMDNTTGSYFGYELEVETVEGTKQFRVSVKPLSPAVQQRLRQESASRKSIGRQEPPMFELQLLRFPEPQIIEDGDTLALDVLVNRQTGVKIVDLITVSSSQIQLPTSPSSNDPARDFRVEDMHLKVWNFQLLINGQLATKSTGGCSGKLIYFYLPGRGRFIFSIAPQEGADFQKIGVIEQNKIAFSLGGETYEWISNAPIIETGGNWNLWVLHEPDYRPNMHRGIGAFSGTFSGDTAITFEIGAADSVQALSRSPKKD